MASQVRVGEEVLVPFAGVGPSLFHPLPGCQGVGPEKNKAACCWLGRERSGKSSS